MVSKQTVLQAGATGYTGLMIAKALTASDQFVVKALVRQSSLSKSETQELEALGVEIVPGDIVTSSPEELDKALRGVDVVISTVLAFVDQKPLLLAAKRAGVKRVVPSEFGPIIPRGGFFMQDLKYAVREFITENEIPYTFIQLGLWTNFMLPYPHGFDGPSENKQWLGAGKVKVAYIAYERVGEFVKRIISDPRTLNKAVFAYDGELTVEESWALAEKISGESFDDYLRLSAEEIESKINNSSRPLDKIFYGYSRTMFVRGDNTVQNALKEGALDARKLYPDYEPPSLEDVVREFYKNPPLFAFQQS